MDICSNVSKNIQEAKQKKKSGQKRAKNGGEEKKPHPKRAKMDSLDSMIKTSAFTSLLPSTPDLSLSTPMVYRAGGETGGRKSLQPVPKPSFTNANIDEEMERALKTVSTEAVFDSPLFTSPIPTTQMKRASKANPSTIGTAPFTAGGGNGHNANGANTSFTPMLQNLFDSPFPQFDTTTSFTPFRFDLTTARKGRKALAVPYT